ncbi:MULTISPECIES: hypothetical protein [Thermomonospora]|uniref:Uncharacterized protein n=1 Tax=Thermomonospora curvata (strain ATCC 19995 / DSM 43183 / JCM 3096 / KCTC 9072 / NBRC 15933 / NCIMB 10081 / Henssen B9) TaxID=471852 RepID=D1A698_THECD|nr:MULTISPECIES: hypothetical protein [Thermomonospora]ACZ00197.1 hypothetical protein Tcur_4675 [Thermomonospora curvata DSM 43183]PKK12007.1 MAG: hypothetical protein BUE48_022940 [Thermomonospora sp. CIF 1]
MLKRTAATGLLALTAGGVLMGAAPALAGDYGVRHDNALLRSCPSGDYGFLLGDRRSYSGGGCEQVNIIFNGNR